MLHSNHKHLSVRVLQLITTVILLGLIGEKAWQTGQMPRCWHELRRLKQTCNDRRMKRVFFHTRTLRNRSAFPITETELKLIAAAAIIGLGRMPKKGYSTPAATGTPKLL